MQHRFPARNNLRREVDGRKRSKGPRRRRAPRVCRTTARVRPVPADAWPGYMVDRFLTGPMNRLPVLLRGVKEGTLSTTSSDPRPPSLAPDSCELRPRFSADLLCVRHGVSTLKVFALKKRTAAVTRVLGFHTTHACLPRSWSNKRQVRSRAAGEKPWRMGSLSRRTLVPRTATARGATIPRSADRTRCSCGGSAERRPNG
jgi:hypothetical protein